MSKKERLLLFLLAAINFTHILDFMIMMPLGNYLMTYFQISTHQFSIIVSSYSYSAFATGIIAAFVVDNFDRKNVLLVGYCGFIVGTILCGFAPSYKLLIAARIIAGLFGGLIGAQVFSIIADYFSYEKRGRAMGYIMTAFSVASVIGVPFSLYLSNLFSWHAPFILVGVLGIFLIPFIIWLLPSMTGHINTDSDSEKIGSSFFIVMSQKQNLLALSFSAFLMLGHFIIIPFINPYMEFNVGFTRNQIPMIYVVGGLATFFSAPMFGRLADKFGKLKIFTICAIASLPAIYLVTNMPVIDFYLVLLITGIWFIMANGRSVAAQAMISNVVESKYRGSFMSINSSLQQLFIGTASVIAGLIVTDDATKRIQHYEWVGYLSILIIIASIYMARVLGKKQIL